MKPVKDMMQAELAAFVQVHLRKSGIHVVLTGGAAVSIHSKAKYVSLDLDLVIISSVGIRTLRKSMEQIGFSGKGRHFRHPESKFPVEFLPGPLAFGDEEVAKIDEIELSTGMIKIISPTDCVKDRLAHFYHWGDRQCLQQAIMVAETRDVDMDDIAAWSSKEGKAKELAEFKANMR